MTLLMTRGNQTMVQWRLRSECRMASRFRIPIIAVQYWILIEIEFTTHMNYSVLMRLSVSRIPIWYTNCQLTNSLATSFQFQDCREPCVWPTRFGQCSSVWGDGFGILIDQECWWRMKCILAIRLPQWQRLWYFNSWLRKVFWSCYCQLCWGILLTSGWVLCRMTILGFSVKNESGIHCTDSIQCLAAF